MFAQRRFAWFLVALVGATMVSSVPGLARAGIILAVSTDFQPGVIACLGVNGQCVYVPLTANPARAFNGGVEAALVQNGSDISFAFTLHDTSGQNQYASTALMSSGIPQPLQITIIGTAGEPAGTPVLLQLNTGTDVDPNTAQEITNQLNNTEYPPITDQIIDGFNVGDTFFYWPSVDAPGNTPIIFSGVLSVQEAGNSAVPEPGTLALLMTAGLALGVLSLRRRWSA